MISKAAIATVAVAGITLGGVWLWPAAVSRPVKEEPTRTNSHAASFEMPPDLKPPPASPLLVNSVNGFGLKLFKHLVKRESRGNAGFSPLSISQAFYLLGNAARGNTEIALKRELGLGSTNWEAINDASRQWLEWAQGSENAGLSIVNAIFTRPEVSVEPDYLTTVALYNAHVAPMDRDAAVAVAEINEWVAHHTSNTITKIVHGVSRTDVLLANAVYFKGTWLTPFNKSLTEEADFFAADGSVQRCKMMVSPVTHHYTEWEGNQAVSLHYTAALKMVVILPPKGTTAQALLESLTPERYQELKAGLNVPMTNPQANVFLPQFEISNDYALLPALLEMGLEAAIVKADYTRLDPNFIDAGLSQAVHKVVINVDEEGTVAAAATGLMIAGMAALEEPRTVDFRADRPFVFTIEDGNGMILFMGVMNSVSDAP